MSAHRSRPCRFVAAAALAGLACLGPGALAQPAATAALERLATRAATEGSVRVIVGLELPTQAEGRLPAGMVVQQRASIRAAQNTAVNQLLMGTASRAHTRFDTIPFLAIEADANAMARLRSSPLVRHIQEDRLATPSLLQSNPLIHATTAWSHGHSGAGWAVAVLDTGVDKTHPFLAGKVVSEACYSSNFSHPDHPQHTSQTLCPGGATATTAAGSAMPCAGLCAHGTHVAGIAAGGTAADGSHGVARDAGIIAVQVFSYFPAYNNVMSWSSDQIKGLERVYALRGTYDIAAVNMSLGGGQFSSTCDNDDPATKSAIDNLRSAGIATVIAAGNDGWRTSISAPACISSAVSVAASCDVADGGYCATGVDGIAGYSNMAGFVSLVAPGSVISSAVPGGGYAGWHGTSMATPQVAGAWAVLKQAQPALGVTEALALFANEGLAVNDTRSGGSVTGLARVDLGFLAPSAYTLSVSTTGTGAGTVASADGYIACGSVCDHRYAGEPTVTLTASAAPGSVFTGWSGDCAGTAATCTVSMTAARSVGAGFAGAYTLTVAKAGPAAASGTVTSSPAGISCGSDCSEAYAGGTSVTLTATAGTGARFTGWSGACTGTASTCTVGMTAARSVTATFAAYHTLTVTKAGSGAASGTVKSTPAGISCGTDCEEAYAGGASVTLTATATAAARFTGWAGACAGTQSTCTVGMTAAQSVTANFIARYALTVQKTGTAAAAGTVTSAPLGIDCGSDCIERYDSGTEVTLTAVAGDDAKFTGWSGACTGKLDTCTVSLSASRTVKAAFNTQQPLTVSIGRIVDSANGTVTSSPVGISCGSTCGAEFNTGSSVTLTAKAASGSRFVGWSGACTGTASTCTVGMTAAQAVTATFNRHYTLTVIKRGTAAATGTVTSVPAGIDCGSDCAEILEHGRAVTLTAVAGPDSRFTGWSGACIGTLDTCTVDMTAARTAYATFHTQEVLTVSIDKLSGTAGGTVTSSPAGISCGATCSAEFNTGSAVKLTAKVASGSVFVGWGGACTGTASTCTVSMASAQSVSAAFNTGYTLSVSKTGVAAASGVVTSVPAGIDCGGACSNRYEVGTSVTLTATGSADARFVGWSGACAGADSTCTVVMSAARSITATFEEPVADLRPRR
jgi:hypothetical protein